MRCSGLPGTETIKQGPINLQHALARWCVESGCGHAGQQQQQARGGSRANEDICMGLCLASPGRGEKRYKVHSCILKGLSTSRHEHARAAAIRSHMTNTSCSRAQLFPPVHHLRGLQRRPQQSQDSTLEGKRVVPNLRACVWQGSCLEPCLYCSVEEAAAAAAAQAGVHTPQLRSSCRVARGGAQVVV